jgi:hypothetical protein
MEWKGDCITNRENQFDRSLNKATQLVEFLLEK